MPAKTHTQPICPKCEAVGAFSAFVVEAEATVLHIVFCTACGYPLGVIPDIESPSR